MPLRPAFMTFMTLTLTFMGDKADFGPWQRSCVIFHNVFGGNEILHLNDTTSSNWQNRQGAVNVSVRLGLNTSHYIPHASTMSPTNTCIHSSLPILPVTPSGVIKMQQFFSSQNLVKSELFATGQNLLCLP